MYHGFKSYFTCFHVLLGFVMFADVIVYLIYTSLCLTETWTVSCYHMEGIANLFAFIQEFYFENFNSIIETKRYYSLL